MRTLLLFLTFSLGLTAQTVIRYDRMETWDWLGGWWTPIPTAGWYTNASVTPTESAAMYGAGSSTSTIEADWYRLPNVSGLNPSNTYQFAFRLASYTFSNSAASTRGVDVADYVSVQVSTNGGLSYVTELRITGNSNSTWPYNNTGAITHNANGSFTNSAAPTGDVYTSPAGVNSTGPSRILLNLPAGITQVAVDIYCRVNSAGEEWWIDNIELLETVAISLPVELVSFDGKSINGNNLLQWKTASESNTSHYTIKRLKDDLKSHEELGTISAAGNSTELLDYSFIDDTYQNKINYYVLTQFDIDGNFEEFGPISIDNRKPYQIVRVTNILGQEVSLDSEGLLIITYSDGSSKKVFK